MKTFTIHIDKNNLFNQIFIPLSYKFAETLRSNGVKVLFDEDSPKDDVKIIFGSHANPEYWINKIKPDDIIVNLEPIFKIDFRDANNDYLKLLNKCNVLDYSIRNLDFLENGKVFNIPPFFVSPQNTNNLEFEKNFDILFVGSVNNFRDINLKILNAKYKLATGFKIFSNNLDLAIKKSKLYIHLNQDKNDLFNHFKFAHCLPYPTVYAGHSGFMDDNHEIKSLENSSIFKENEDLLKGIEILLNDKKIYSNILEKQKKISGIYNDNFNNFIRELLSN
jgi:hypothetical protein